MSHLKVLAWLFWPFFFITEDVGASHISKEHSLALLGLLGFGPDDKAYDEREDSEDNEGEGEGGAV